MLVEKIKEAEKKGIDGIAGELVIDEKLKFEDLGINKPLCDACYNLGYKHPSDIQREAIPHALKGRDIIGLAETGSGKTAAFVIPILQGLLKSPSIFYALILSPTRELAFQIKETVTSLGVDIGVKCAVLIGGIDTATQSITLANKPHIIIATPGRVIDHLENTKGFTLKNLKCLVLDEADRLLNMDFEKELNRLLEIIPRNRKTYLYSATMTKKVAKLQRACLKDPVKLEVSRRYKTVKSLKQEYIFIPAKYKDVNMISIMNELNGKSIMIFTNTIKNTEKISYILKALGFSVIALHGRMHQNKRLESLNKFKSGNNSILVATDVASRGLDIPTVNIVLNYDIPLKSKDYIHRVGRTARAGRSGRTIAIVTQYDVELFQRIEKLIGIKMKEYPNNQEEVMLLYERVLEATKVASIKMKESSLKMVKRRKNKMNYKRNKRKK